MLDKILECLILRATKTKRSQILNFKIMLQVINYSDKAVALIGDTKAIKDTLKAMGGKFNPRLSCGAGWIFSAKKRDELQRLITTGEATTTKAEQKAVPAVYCGTYKKYNEGSIAGAWVRITDYANGEEVLKACAKLHKDEADPEFMFQDKENFPDWFYSECMGAKEFDAVIAWWKEEQAKPKEKADALIEEYVKEMGGDDYYREKTSKVIRLSNGGLMDWEKQSINTRFCFHDEGPDYEFYKSLTSDDDKLKAYFFGENLRDYDRVINGLNGKDGKNHEYRLYRNREDKNVWEFADFNGGNYYYTTIRDKSIEMTDPDRLAILQATEELKEKMRKRLETWWKRYGKDKLYLWTYWADA